MTDLADVFRAEYGRAVAVLVRLLGDIDLAEEAVQDAFTEAVRRWPVTGPPPSPAGWIITTARNRASTGTAGSPPGTSGRPRRCSCGPTSSRRDRCGTTGCG